MSGLMLKYVKLLCCDASAFTPQQDKKLEEVRKNKEAIKEDEN